jgi:hypothetical protein
MAQGYPAICVVGDTRDVNLIHLSGRARRRGFQVIELAEARFGCDWLVTRADPQTRSARVDLEGEALFTDQLAGFFVRLTANPSDSSRALTSGQGAADPEAGPGLREFFNAIGGVVVNRPGSGRRDGDQHGLTRLARLGFKVPAALHRYIPGKDVRVHTVAGQAFATEIGSAGIDHRFHGESGAYRARLMPEPLAELCCRAAARSRLWLAGFDFRVSHDDDWICVGMDVAPDFAHFERATGQPIADRVLDLFETRSFLLGAAAPVVHSMAAVA